MADESKGFDINAETFTAMFKHRIEAVFKEKAKTVDDQITRIIDQNLTRMVVIALGFEQDSWRNEWRVDHCNGRQSPLTSRISQKALEHAQLMFDMFIVSDVGLFVDKKMFDGMKEAVRKEFTEKVHRKLHELVQKYADKEATRIAQEIVDGAVNDLRKGEQKVP